MSKYKWYICILQAITILLFIAPVGCIPVAPDTSSQAKQSSDDEQAQSAVIPEPENHPPVIVAIAAPKTVALSNTVDISCVAKDEDGDILFYTWSADKGAFEGSGKNILWTAPDVPGDCIITSTVTDGKGGEIESHTTITVASMTKINRPPIIRSILVTPRGKQSVDVTLASQALRIRRWDVVDIKCIAIEPDGEEMSFVWTATAGKLSGEGDMIEYIASEGKDQVITVTVMDSAGYSTSSEILLSISCCGG